MENDHKPLLDPGIHSATIDEVEATCVAPFPADKKRIWLLNRLKIYVEHFSKLDAMFEFWLDGSFVTTKHNPGDIDVTIWFIRLMSTYS